jgi:hypothetical protein
LNLKFWLYAALAPLVASPLGLVLVVMVLHDPPVAVLELVHPTLFMVVVVGAELFDVKSVAWNSMSFWVAES